MAVLLWFLVKSDAIDVRYMYSFVHTGQVIFYKEPEKYGHV